MRKHIFRYHEHAKSDIGRHVRHEATRGKDGKDTVKDRGIHGRPYVTD